MEVVILEEGIEPGQRARPVPGDESPGAGQLVVVVVRVEGSAMAGGEEERGRIGAAEELFKACFLGLLGRHGVKGPLAGQLLAKGADQRLGEVGGTAPGGFVAAVVGGPKGGLGG